MPRDSGGTYTLTSGNPVTAGSVVATTWGNTLFSDLATEITNSLDRSGRGGMLAALKGVDGSASAPTFGFTAESNTGFWRASAGRAMLSLLGNASHVVSGAGAVAAALQASTDNTLTDNAQMSIDVPAGGYSFICDIVLFLGVATPPSSGGGFAFKTTFSGTAAAESRQFGRFRNNSVETLIDPVAVGSTHAFATPIYSGPVPIVELRVILRNVTVAGVLKIQQSQATTNANAVQVLAGSYFSGLRVAA